MTAGLVQLADAPAAPTSVDASRLLCVPPAADYPHRLAAAPGGSRAMERAVLRPVDLTVTHGLKVLGENLQRMVETYDPAYEAAMINFDHNWGGPSHGHCVRLWMEGEFLWARFERLSEQAAQGIASGEWARCSSEIYASHPVLRDWYFFGLALLGSQSPAVPGLGAARLLSRPIYRLALTEETRSEVSEHAAPANGEETKEEDMTEKSKETPAGAETKSPEPTPPAPAAAATPAEPKPASDPEVAKLAAKVEGQIAGLQADRQALATQLAAIRLERAEVAADKTLSTRLERKLTPAQAKLARPLFVALAALEAHLSVKLAGGPSDTKPVDVPVLDRVVEILAAGQDYSALFSRVADSDPADRGATTLSAAEKAAGLTSEEAARIEAKYPTSFTDPTN